MSPQRTLSQSSLHRLENQLAERRRSADAMVEAFFTEARDAHLTADNSDRFDSESPIGTASEESFTLAEYAAETVREIERALSRIASGLYGHCEVCGEAIAYQRLRALPSTTLCFDCKSLARRPGPLPARSIDRVLP